MPHYIYKLKTEIDWRASRETARHWVMQCIAERFYFICSNSDRLRIKCGCACARSNVSKGGGKTTHPWENLGFFFANSSVQTALIQIKCFSNCEFLFDP